MRRDTLIEVLAMQAKIGTIMKKVTRRCNSAYGRVCVRRVLVCVNNEIYNYICLFFIGKLVYMKII